MRLSDERYEEIMEKFWTTFSLAGCAIGRFNKRFAHGPKEFTNYERELIALAKEGENSLNK